MTLTILGIALGASMVLFGGPGELGAYVDRTVREVIDFGMVLLRTR